MLKLYNTLTRKKEVFKPLNPPYVGMYTCGMTVYDHTHLGHMRTYTNTDFLRRTLEYNGFKVKHVENVTDVGHLTSEADTGEDKLEKRAKERKESVWEIAQRYTKEFFETTDALNILRPHIVCKATEHIKEMIELVKKLDEKGFAYMIPGDGVYFDTAKLPDYGKLARLDIEGLKAGARIKQVAGKRNITDFALWKFTPKGETRQMEWESLWAPPGGRGKLKGFPGWHIECSAMSMKYLGETFDLHTGGVDHIPVHHTNEIAQSEAATGRPFVKYWFHNEFLMVEGQKMSKSLGNFYWMEDVKKRGFDLLSLRYLFLTAHYRSRMNFTWEGLEGAQKALNRLREGVATFTSRPFDKLRVKNRSLKAATPVLTNFFAMGGPASGWSSRFKAAINDDLNMPQALSVVWDLVKEAQKNKNLLPVTYDLLYDFDRVLGLRLTEVKPIEIKVPAEVQKLVDEREELRKQKKWKEADKIRKKIRQKGFIIEDTPEGPHLKRAH